jgi:UDP-3-O-[3-hydroxymyristoyl] glucosamine N-acyltransferase
VGQTLKQLADLVKGELSGDAQLIISGARPLKEAQATDITFVENEKNAPLLHECRAAAAVVPP